MRLLAANLACVLAVGCSTYAQPHQPYAPLLDRGGQVDLAGTVGMTNQAAPAFAAHAAVAPIDHLVVVAGAEIEPVDDQTSRTSHFAGELGVGAFVVGEPHLRAEVLAGFGAGYGTGQYVPEDPDEGITLLDGPYLRPFAQGTIVGVHEFFSGGAGLRVASTIAWLTEISPSGVGTFIERTQLHIDPYLTVRFRHQALVVELTGGGSVSVLDGVLASMLTGYIALTVHGRFDAWPPASESPAAE